MADTIYEYNVSGISGVSGVFYFLSGTEIASGVAGDLSPYIQYFEGETGYQFLTLTQNTNFTGVEDILVPLFSGTDLGAFASGIYGDLLPASGSPFGVAYIESWLISHIGDLNNNLQQNFSTISGFALPPLNYQEVAIYEELFNAYYYNRSATNLLGASAYDWTMLQEADSRVVKVSRNELAKTYRQLALDSREKLLLMVAQYRQNAGQPLAVIGTDEIFIPYGYNYGFGAFNNVFPYYNWFFVRDGGF